MEGASGALAEQLASWSAPPREAWATLQQPLDAASEVKVANQVRLLSRPVIRLP